MSCGIGRRHSLDLTPVPGNPYAAGQPEKNKKSQVCIPIVAQQDKNPTSIHEDVGLIAGLPPWAKDPALLQSVA